MGETAETNMISRLIVTALVIGAASAYVNEVWNQEQTEAAGLVHKGNSTISPLPHEYLATSQLPTNFSWCDHEGVNYCTKSLNQHMLNCGGVGSCYGGSVDGPYQWLHKISQSGGGISYAPSNPYMACSSDSKQGFCGSADWTCT